VLRVSAQNEPASFEFIENKGQWERQVQYKGELSTGAFYLHSNGFTVNLLDKEDLRAARDPHPRHNKPTDKKSKQIDYSKDLSGRVIDRSVSNNPASRKIKAHAYRVEFIGANLNAQPLPEKQVASHNNYFIGNDPSKWTTDVKIYNVVTYQNLYPNIDVRYYSESGALKYDLIVRPGGDPSKIILKYTGADKISVRNNDLIIKTSVEEVKELYPYSYQVDNLKGRKKIDCKYLVDGNTVRFQIAEYSKNSILVIDPTLIFSSFTGSPANQYGFTATPGPDGSLFSGGIVFEAGFPVTPGAYQASFAGPGTKGTDIGIMKFSPNGSQRVYATYIGGGGNEYPHSLFSDAQGNLVVMGRTYSSDYPGTVVGTGAANGNANIIVTKLNATGSALFGSLSIGGSGSDGVNIKDLQQSQDHGNESLVRNYGDDSRSEVILDGGGFIYVAAQTKSTDFPIRNAFQGANAGSQDGVVMKIDPTCNNIIWASYLGGSGDDGAFVLDLNPTTGNVYVGGGTGSTDFPAVAGGTIATSNNGGIDGFVTVISNGGALQRSTYIGTNNVDIIYGLKFDRKGFPYVMGTTRGSWPARGNPMPLAFGGSDNSQFVAKLQPDLSAYVYTTTFGNGAKKPNISPVAFLVDRCENLYISGWGGWINRADSDPYDQAGVVNMPVSSDAIKPGTDNNDFYFIVIQKNASAVLYGTYFGQTNGEYGEHVDGGTSRYDQQGIIYQAICANCYGGARFPTTPGVIGPVNGSDECNLAAVKMSFDFAGVAAGPRAYLNGVPDTAGCAPMTLELRDTIRNAVSYEWSFGDGTPDVTTTEFNLQHTFQNVGTYRVRLIAIDPNSCNERDTAYLNIRVGDAGIQLGIQNPPLKLEPCEQLNYQFTNISTLFGTNPRPFNDSTFTWDFGDGSPRVRTGGGPITHSYDSVGTYQVRLIVTDTSYCNAPDSVTLELRVSDLVRALFETPDKGCAPYTAFFNNTSLAGQQFTWDFGDGSPVSNEVNPIHEYVNPGRYTVRLTAVDNNTCNKVDDTTMVIDVYEKPTAAFTYTPVTPEVNKPTIFYNNSVGGVRHVWYFGDGDSVIKTNMDTVLHQYNVTDTFTAMLVTYNAAGCPDTAVQQVASLIDPLLDVPNAFTPGRFGKNSVVRVEGFGIVKMSWKIYNRWGQKVFETNDRRAGWDGTFNGKLLPMDVYTYSLDVQFSDGRPYRKTGDITLIR
jgi:gliding motility-associated-like protein